jgi:hypothetical protein
MGPSTLATGSGNFFQSEDAKPKPSCGDTKSAEGNDGPDELQAANIVAQNAATKKWRNLFNELAITQHLPLVHRQDQA